ncbi:isochorismatase family protein [Entomohabitans teleogrylli]|uniref:isochorismatase family protein n=1 Tax=Entomohabitans teleogrylli TaxID=1384589 RepID=UPI00073D820A|nr:isochorismatase family protein [Entomohabitans teleogrylli]
MQQKVLMVIDMQNGVFANPRYDRAGCCERINQLIDQADRVIFIQHTGEGLEPGSEAFALLGELHCPDSALYVTKTACDAFFRTGLAALLRENGIQHMVICGCATDYCVDATIKNGLSRGFAITVAQDAHTTADRAAAGAEVLIAHYNDVWRDFIIPDGALRVRSAADILVEWRG